jgi:hypothetical protein
MGIAHNSSLSINQHCSTIRNAVPALLSNGGSGGNEEWWTIPLGLRSQTP